MCHHIPVESSLITRQNYTKTPQWTSKEPPKNPQNRPTPTEDHGRTPEEHGRTTKTSNVPPKNLRRKPIDPRRTLEVLRWTPEGPRNESRRHSEGLAKIADVPIKDSRRAPEEHLKNFRVTTEDLWITSPRKIEGRPITCITIDSKILLIAIVKNTIILIEKIISTDEETI